MDNIKRMFFVSGALVILNGCTTFSSLGETEEIDDETVNVTFRIHFEDDVLEFDAEYYDGTYIKDFDADLYWGTAEGDPIGLGISLELEIASLEEFRIKAKTRITINTIAGWQNIRFSSHSTRIPTIRQRFEETNLWSDFQYGDWIDFLPEEAMKANADEESLDFPRVQYMISRMEN